MKTIDQLFPRSPLAVQVSVDERAIQIIVGLRWNNHSTNESWKSWKETRELRAVRQRGTQMGVYNPLT